MLADSVLAQQAREPCAALPLWACTHLLPLQSPCNSLYRDNARAIKLAGAQSLLAEGGDICNNVFSMIAQPP